MKNGVLAFLFSAFPILGAPFPTHWGPFEERMLTGHSDFTNWVDTAGSSDGGFFTVAVRETATQSILWANGTVSTSPLATPFSAVQCAMSDGNVKHLAFFEGNEVRYGRKDGVASWSFETLEETGSPGLGIGTHPMDLLVENSPNGEVVTLVWRASGGAKLRVARRVGSSAWQAWELSDSAALTPRLAKGRWPGVNTSFRSGPSVVWIDDQSNETRVKDYGLNSFLPTVFGWSVERILSEIPASNDGVIDGLAIDEERAWVMHRVENPGTQHTLGVLEVTPAPMGGEPWRTYRSLFAPGVFTGGSLGVSGDGVPFYLFAREVAGEFEARCLTPRARSSWQNRVLHFDPQVPDLTGTLGFPGTSAFATSAGNAWAVFSVSNGILTERRNLGPGLFLWKEQRLLGGTNNGYLALDFLPGGERVEAFAISSGAIEIRKVSSGSGVTLGQVSENLAVGLEVDDIAITTNGDRIAVVYEVSGAAETGVSMILYDHSLNEISRQAVAVQVSPVSQQDRVNNGVADGNLEAEMNDEFLFCGSDTMTLHVVRLSDGQVTRYLNMRGRSLHLWPEKAGKNFLLGGNWFFDAETGTATFPLELSFGYATFWENEVGEATALDFRDGFRTVLQVQERETFLRRLDVSSSFPDQHRIPFPAMSEGTASVSNLMVFRGQAEREEAMIFAKSGREIRPHRLSASLMDSMEFYNELGSPLPLGLSSLDFGNSYLKSESRPGDGRSIATIGIPADNTVWFVEELDRERTDTISAFPLPVLVSYERDVLSGDIHLIYRLMPELSSRSFQYRLESSQDLVNWRTVVTLAEIPAGIPDPLRPGKFLNELTLPGDDLARDYIPLSNSTSPVVFLRDLAPVYFRIKAF